MSANTIFRKLLLDLFNLCGATQQCFHAGQVELYSGQLAQKCKCLLVVSGGLVRSAAGQSVKHVGHGDDAGLQRNFSAGQPHWVAASIQRLMVVGCDIPQQFHAAFPV